VHLVDQQVLGILILILLAILVIAKQVSTGSILDKPEGNLLVQAVNIFNLFFLLVVNPLAAILLIIRRLVEIDISHITINNPWALTFLEAVGLVLYVTGFILMAWALKTLKRNYQLGGSAPRSQDELVVSGPYRLIRHPMYAAAMSISIGLSFLTQSLAYFFVFCIYLFLVLPLISMEEAGLRHAYGAKYESYKKMTRKLIPFIY
jgi:protein-S-isoprenylcysteine O-methyltransferase Ste14